ncbi:MAG: hypothetical protein GY863_21545 [bacterium]|nr:hypothetical protein [bacterium]
MLEYRKFMILMLSVFMLAGTLSAQELPELKGPYLGQEPPGMTPEIFAPGFVSTDAHEFSCTFSPDGDEFYFARSFGENRRKYIIVTKLRNGVWTEPEKCLPQFDNEHFEPHITLDGKKMFFMGFHLVEANSRPNIDMYYSEREGDGWGEPNLMGAPFNPAGSMSISLTKDGTIYTTNAKKMGIARSRLVNGKYQDYEDLPSPINTEHPEMHPFIAPDESYLIFESGRLGMDKGLHLYVAFRSKDDSWSDPQEIPVGMPGGIPTVSPDGKYLFFVGGRPGDIYWIDSKIFKNLNPEK